MTTPQQPFQSLRGLPQRLSQQVLQHLAPRQLQYALLSALLAGGVGLLWLCLLYTSRCV